MITVGELHKLLDYDPATGVFRWKVAVCNRVRGSVAGSPRREHGYPGGERGYIVITVNHKHYYAHRLAWFYIYGVWPTQLDHLDRNKRNNAINNLRLATSGENGANSVVRHDSPLGMKGVRKRKYAYQARFGTKHLGYFKSKEAAMAAYTTEAKRLYGSFAGRQ